MNTKTIVILLQEDSTNHGEVTSFDQTHDAERFLEDLLASGFDQRSIRVLAAKDLDILIKQKPVVSFVSSGTALAVEPPAAPVTNYIQPVIEDLPVTEDLPEFNPEPVYVEAMESNAERELVSVAAASDSHPDAEPEPYTQNGVRFSSAFAREY